MTRTQWRSSPARLGENDFNYFLLRFAPAFTYTTDAPPQHTRSTAIHALRAYPGSCSLLGNCPDWWSLRTCTKTLHTSGTTCGSSSYLLNSIEVYRYGMYKRNSLHGGALGENDGKENARTRCRWSHRQHGTMWDMQPCDACRRWPRDICRRWSWEMCDSPRVQSTRVGCGEERRSWSRWMFLTREQ